MAKKKGPPYTDDPGCKYIVIDDPWPGTKQGRDRKDNFFNLVGMWVYFMLNRKDIPESIFSVNTRAEVIVKLPEHVDITPILGAHVWRQCFTDGAPQDIERVSYVFEYNYRTKGDPGSHQWSEHYPIVDPIPRGFPVRQPYAPMHWATHQGRNCADLALPLPKTRQRTPTPPPNEFTPYHAPAHLDAARAAQFVEEGEGQTPDVQCAWADDREVKPELEAAAPVLFVDKRDPYEEEDAALQFVKQEPCDSSASSIVKQEITEVRVKEEVHDVPVKMEEQRAPATPAQAQPSAAFLAAFQRLEQRTRAAQGQTAVSPSTPENAQLSAQLANENAGRGRPAELVRVKPEPEEHTLPLSSTSFQHPRSLPDSRVGSVRSFDGRMPTTGRHQSHVKPEPEDATLPSQTPGVRHHSRTDPVRPQDPRLRARDSLKRPKQEDEDEFIKRVKTENIF